MTAEHFFLQNFMFMVNVQVQGHAAHSLNSVRLCLMKPCSLEIVYLTIGSIDNYFTSVTLVSMNFN